MIDFFSRFPGWVMDFVMAHPLISIALGVCVLGAGYLLMLNAILTRTEPRPGRGNEARGHRWLDR